MHLLLVRHGETLWNIERRIQGWGDSPLSETGRAQAGQLAVRLAHVPLAAVYASDLGRAVDTASIVAAPHALPVQTLKDLRETSWGDWEGKTAHEIELEQPGLWAKFTSRGRERAENEDEADWETSTIVPNGETLLQASQRIAAALKTIRQAHTTDDETVLVVGHGGSLRFFVTQALGLPPRRIRRLHLDNASLTHILYLGGRSPIIKCFNDVGHYGALSGK